MKTYRKNLVVLVIAVGIFFMPLMADAGCRAGGPGQSSCAVKSETVIFGLTLWKIERSVSGCPDGTYACCKFIGSGCKDNN